MLPGVRCPIASEALDEPDEPVNIVSSFFAA
jgi:hypothetical protein